MFSTVSNLLLGSGSGGSGVTTTADEPTVDPTAADDDAAMTAFEIEFWKNYDDDMFGSPMPFDASEGGLWNGRFVPPPPRPPFMDDAVTTDGVTTCDLCTWAFQDKSAFSLEGSLEAAGELGWAFSIGLVSVISALIGAIIMITLVRCKRLKTTNANNNHHPHHHHHHQQHNGQPGGRAVANLNGNGMPAAAGSSSHLWWCRKSNVDPHVSEMHHSTMPKHRPAESLPAAHANPQVWIWLKNVNTPPTPEPIQFPPSASIENYYTNTDDSCLSSPCKVNEVVYEEISGIG